MYKYEVAPLCYIAKWNVSVRKDPYIDVRY